MKGPVIRSLGNGVLRLVLNDPSSRNSLSETMIEALHEALEEAAGDPEVRVIVISAMGPVYCSGHNLKEITAHRSGEDGGEGYFKTLFQACAGLMLAIVRNPKPVVAEVQGMASAAGCQLVASCDLAVASEAAQFCTPGVNIGLFCSTPMVALSRNVGSKHAMEMLLTGDAVTAEDALRIGLVNRVVPPNMLAEAVDALAGKIAEKSQMTVKTGKQAFYTQKELSLDEAYAFTARVMAENMMKHDAEEGISAFIGKRAAKWADQ